MIDRKGTTMKLSIIYQDNDIVVVNKPAGMAVHKGVAEKGETLADWLIEKFPEIKQVGDEPELRPGIVHRLDKDTSGVLVAARNQKSFEFLKNQFQKREVVKKYLALVEGELKNENGANASDKSSFQSHWPSDCLRFIVRREKNDLPFRPCSPFFARQFFGVCFSFRREAETGGRLAGRFGKSIGGVAGKINLC